MPDEPSEYYNNGHGYYPHRNTIREINAIGHTTLTELNTQHPPWNWFDTFLRRALMLGATAALWAVISGALFLAVWSAVR